MELKPVINDCWTTATPEQREFMGRFVCPQPKQSWLLAPGLGLGMGTSGAGAHGPPPPTGPAFSTGFSLGFS
mgnify:CR=1 FL=1